MANIVEKISYGVYVVTTLDTDGSKKGCIANCATQITAVPATFAISINRDNYTNVCINKTKRFAISILAEDSDPSMIGTFGFKSSRDTDKFAAVAYGLADGLPVIKDSCGYIVCNVIDSMETATHTIFLGEMTTSALFGDRPAMTYDYYHKAVKGKAPKNAPTFIAPDVPPTEDKTAKKAAAKRKFVCKICGYEYEGEELPKDFVCPICGVSAEEFTEVK